jgi:hypothetical protein
MENAQFVNFLQIFLESCAFVRRKVCLLLSFLWLRQTKKPALALAIGQALKWISMG